jgi:transposase InsO family protein
LDHEILSVLVEPIGRFAPLFGLGPTIQNLADRRESLPRQQLAFYQERRNRPRRIDNPTRLTLLYLSRRFNWRNALCVVTPRTFIGWHRKGFQLFWRRKCQSGRPRIPPELQRLIRRMADENPSWGEERIANELLLKLGLRVLPRTIRKYLPKLSAPGANHPAAISVGQPSSRITPKPSLRARLLRSSDSHFSDALCVCGHGTCFMPRILHINVTAHPTAAWTLQQLREAIPSDDTYRFILHDRDAIFSTGLDASLARLGLEVIATPVRSPQANSLCERLIGTLRRECMDWIIPLSEEHLRKILWSWLPHYNRGRPHSSLGPGLLDPLPNSSLRLQRQRHRFDRPSRVIAHSVVKGLHHEYSLRADNA